MQLVLLSVVVLQMQRLVYAESRPGRIRDRCGTALAVRATVVERLVKTTIEEIICNGEMKSQEAVLTLNLQTDAYITEFSAFSLNSGETVQGAISPLDDAARNYGQQKKEGLTTGIVYAREKGVFALHLNIAANETAVFRTAYEEIVTRRLGVVQQTIKVSQQFPVKETTVNVEIIKAGAVKGVRVLSHTNDTKIRKRNETIYLMFSESQQNRHSSDLTFIYEYDVGDTQLSGLVRFQEDFFVHYFAPDWLTPIPKTVVFVVDVSGSMSGDKITDTKSALQKILQTLMDPADLFALLTFNDSVAVWKQAVVPASEKQTSAAVNYIDSLVPGGSTNIGKALLAAFQLLHNSVAQSLDALFMPIVVFLTDGEPTEGVLSSKELRRNVKDANKGLGLLYCLGFGADANMRLLRQLAYENGGSGRHIREGDSLVTDFVNTMKELSVPLMKDVRVSYSGVEYTSCVKFPSFFRGSEIVIVGKMERNNHNYYTLDFNLNYSTSTADRNGYSSSAQYLHQDVRDVAKGSLERLYANKRCHELYSQFLVADGEDARQTWDSLLNVSLSYGLVTPATAMVIVQTNGGNVTRPTGTYNSSNVVQFVKDDSPQVDHAGMLVVQGGPLVIHGAIDHGWFASDGYTSTTSSSSNRALIVGVSVGFGVLLILGLLAVGIAVRRRKSQSRTVSTSCSAEEGDEDALSSGEAESTAEGMLLEGFGT